MAKLIERKIIKRRYVTNGVYMTTEEGYFLCTGVWADGHLAYSRVTKDGDMIEEGEYYQVRGVVGNGQKYVNCLYMLHV